jgi:hypothetical protein
VGEWPERISAVSIEVSCPRCGAHLRPVNERRPRGFSSRERGLVLACVRANCPWEGSLEYELVDLGSVRRRRAS